MRLLRLRILESFALFTDESTITGRTRWIRYLDSVMFSEGLREFCGKIRYDEK